MSRSASIGPSSSVITPRIVPTVLAPGLRPWHSLGIGLAASAVVLLALGSGGTSLPGLVVLAIVAIAGSVALIATAPQVVLVIGAALISLPVVGHVPPFEAVFLLFTLLAVLRMLETRAVWALRLDRLEVANLAFLAWAAFSGLWCSQRAGFVFGVHRLTVGVERGGAVAAGRQEGPHDETSASSASSRASPRQARFRSSK